MDRQRQPVPMDTRTPRRGKSSGGSNRVLFRRTLAPGMDDEETRYPGAANDGGIRRDKTAWYPTDRVSPVGASWVNWTAAGPPRPELHARNVTYRRMVGTSNTRNLASPLDWTVGMHTDPKIPALGTIQRYVNPRNPQMVVPRQDRLLPGQYIGQSFSQTTKLQGSR